MRRDARSRGLVRLVIVIAALLGLALAFPPVAAQAPVPLHDVGDAVGFGASIDLAAAADPYLDQLRMLDAADDNFTIGTLTFTGTLDAWVTTEVVAETPTAYTIQEDSAVGLRAQFAIEVSSTLFPAAGTHAGTIDPTYGCILPEIPSASRTASADIRIAYLSTTSGTSEWSVSEFALLESQANHTLDLSASSAVTNVPSLEVDFTACEIVVTYETSSVSVTADVDAAVRARFAPALDYFAFPIADGENWSVQSTATLAGTIRGTIGATGLDPDEEQAFFDQLEAAFAAAGLSVTGLSGFPIVLEDIRIMLGLDTYLADGVIDDVPQAVDLTLEAREGTMTLADGQPHTVYLIHDLPVGGVAVSTCSWVYSPDDGFIVGYVCEISPGVFVFELENVPPQEAEGEIDSTRVDYAVGGTATNPLADFFLAPPFLGLLLIAAAVLVIAALLMRGRRRPTMMPPPAMPPPDIPSSPGPPPSP